MTASELKPAVYHIVFDGPPAPDGPRFIEVETPDGKSINAGEWHCRPDGLWELRIDTRAPEAKPVESGFSADKYERAANFCEELSRYFTKKATETTEDKTHWAMRANAETASENAAMLRAAAEQATQLTELSKELEERTVAQDAVEKQLAELRIELQNARDTAGKLFTEHMEYLDSVKAKMMTREELARLICYWMPAPPHATCHDNYCAHKCIAKENPEFEKSMGHLIRGLIEAIISAGVQVRE